MATAPDPFPPDAAVERQTESFSYGQHYYHRTPEKIDFVSLLATAGGHRGLHYYCDSLTCPNTSSLTLKLPPVYTIHIFARDFLTSASHLSEIVFERSPARSEQQVFIYFGEASASLLVKSTDSEKTVALIHDQQTCPTILMPNLLPPHDHVSSTAFSAPVDPTPLDDLLRESQIDHDRILQFVKAADPSFGGAPTPEKGPCPAHMGVGRLIRLRQNQPVAVWVLKDILSAELEPLPPLIAEMGKDLRRMTNLPILLQQLFSMASSDLLSKPWDVEITISRLKFIIRCTRSSSTNAGLAANCQKLVDRLEVPLRYNPEIPGTFRYYAPQLAFEDLYKAAKSSLATSKTVEEKVQKMDDDFKRDKQWSKLYSDTLTSIGKSMNGFINSDDNLFKAKVAIADCEVKRRDLERYVIEANNAMKRFNKGLDEYVRQKKKELVRNIIATSMELVVSVGIAIYTCGAGAPLTLGNLGKAQKAITEGVPAWEKIKTLVEKILNVCAKLLPKLAASWQNLSKFNASLMRLDNGRFKEPNNRKEEADKALKQSVGGISAGTIPTDVMTNVDCLGMIADWDEFDNSVEATFEEMKRRFGENIVDGMMEYQIALKNQAVRGRTVVLALKNEQEAIQFYHRQEAEQRARTARQMEVEKLVKGAAQDPAELLAQQVLRWSMIQELALARQNMFVRCHQLLLALTFTLNRDGVASKIQGTAPLGPQSNVEACAKTLDAMLQEYTNRGKPDQKYTIEINTQQFPRYFPSDWKQRLQDDQELRLAIAPNTLPALKGMADVRVESMNVVFDGMKKLEDRKYPSASIMWEWELGPMFTDVDVQGNLISYYMPTQILRQIYVEGKTSPYQWTDRPRPPIFCREGKIVFLKTPGESGPAPVNLSSVTRVNLTFNCVAVVQRGVAGGGDVGAAAAPSSTAAPDEISTEDA